MLRIICQSEIVISLIETCNINFHPNIEHNSLLRVSIALTIKAKMINKLKNQGESQKLIKKWCKQCSLPFPVFALRVNKDNIHVIKASLCKQVPHI